MMPFGVDWLPPALGQLANAWVQAIDRQAVTDAEAEVDRLLAQDPFRNGRHISEGLYRIDVPPLIVHYSIDQARHRVEVSDVDYAP